MPSLAQLRLQRGVNREDLQQLSAVRKAATLAIWHKATSPAPLELVYRLVLALDHLRQLLDQPICRAQGGSQRLHMEGCRFIG